ncbi:MAG TPA: hypothetical protein PKA61_09565 [Nitrospira sp.]|nr:hypothetical protein [Nitrospira sp.]
MPLTRKSRRRLLAVLAFGFVCLCVLMQVLGSALTLWDCEFEPDRANSLLSEGFSLPVSHLELYPPVIVGLAVERLPKFRQTGDDHMLLRPPNPDV